MIVKGVPEDPFNLLPGDIGVFEEGGFVIGDGGIGDGPDLVDEVAARLFPSAGGGVVLPVAVEHMLQPRDEVFAAEQPVVALEVVVKAVAVEVFP